MRPATPLLAAVLFLLAAAGAEARGYYGGYCGGGRYGSGRCAPHYGGYYHARPLPSPLPPTHHYHRKTRLVGCEMNATACLGHKDLNQDTPPRRRLLLYLPVQHPPRCLQAQARCLEAPALATLAALKPLCLSWDTRVSHDAAQLCATAASLHACGLGEAYEPSEAHAGP